MKKILGLFFSVMLIFGLTVPASADVDLKKQISEFQGTLDLELDLTLEAVLIGVAVLDRTEDAATADALVNQKNFRDAEIAVINIDGDVSDLLMDDAISGNEGIVGVNQASGNLNNQGNVVAMGATDGYGPFVDSQAAVDQKNVSLLDVEILTASVNTLLDSVNHNFGVTGVNQSAGSLNNQANVVAMATGISCGGIAMAEADLGQLNARNFVVDAATIKADLITASVNGNCGVVGVNQSAGNLNNQANVVSISYIGY